jgi:hypothetical protein
MRQVHELLASEEGREYLHERGVLTDATAFVERLRPPARPGLSELAGVPEGAAIVAVGQQVQADYPSAVTSKLRAAARLREPPTITTTALWMDTDKAKGATRITIAGPEGSEDLRLRYVPESKNDVESRFLPVDVGRLRRVVTEVGAWAAGTVPAGDVRDRVVLRAAALAAAVDGAETVTLAQANGDLASVLVREHLHFDGPQTFVSGLLDAGLLEEGVDQALRDLDAFIGVFNDRVKALAADGVDPQVHLLPADYLPLFFSCPSDGLRRRLHRESSGSDQFAVATCRCGTTHRFHLGNGRELSGTELVATGRWSLDVSLPVFVNDHVSGFVTGRSSALYGIVCNSVIETVLGGTPVPLFLPTDLGRATEAPPVPDSLLYDHLVAP